MVMHNGEMEVKVLHHGFFASWMILRDDDAVDEGSVQNPVEMCLPIASGYMLCNTIGLILVSHIHTQHVLVVGINNDWYFKLFLVFSRKKCEICSTCIGTLVVWSWMLSHFQYQ